ncbi:battenin CLN3 protein [Oleoguttula sp. CCFEE 5521]
MLPLPGAAASSWSLFRQRLAEKLNGINWSVAISFWLFGLINNVLYVILLSAALDLVGPNIPKGTVLLADVIPSFFVKLTAPYYIHLIPYSTRIWLFCVLSAAGMLVVGASSNAADAGSISAKMTGVVLASLSSGGGELTFLGLVHHYGHTALAAWGSGTGGAGLIGAGAYALLTTTFGLSVRATLLASAGLPLIMLLSFFVLLPHGPLKLARKEELDAHAASEDDDGSVVPETAGLLTQPGTDHAALSRTKLSKALRSLKTNLLRARKLVIPYMLPLFLVYVAEYTINQGVAPTLLFPLPKTPFKNYRAFYPTYAAIYQLGVFTSRSSLPFIRVRTLYAPSVLQILNLALLSAHAVTPFIPSVYFIFMVIFWEGLLGGLVYVSTFAAIREEVPEEDREFSLGATTVSDSGGICVAGFLSIGMEKALCGWQVSHGRDWCERL